MFSIMFNSLCSILLSTTNSKGSREVSGTEPVFLIVPLVGVVGSVGAARNFALATRNRVLPLFLFIDSVW